MWWRKTLQRVGNLSRPRSSVVHRCIRLWEANYMLSGMANVFQIHFKTSFCCFLPQRRCPSSQSWPRPAARCPSEPIFLQRGAERLQLLVAFPPMLPQQQEQQNIKHKDAIWAKPLHPPGSWTAFMELPGLRRSSGSFSIWAWHISGTTKIIGVQNK